jgi:antitoxin CptB
MNFPRLKRLLYQSCHRGTKENDLILGRFAETHLPTFSEEQLQQYESLLECSDVDLWAWIVGEKPIPKQYDEMIRMIRAYYG